jgi:nicotinate-nucleotide adenylyltransferase
MCDYTTAADERFGLSRIEVDRDGPSYTADTLRALRGRSPGDELVLILGGDQAAALPAWHEPEDVMRLATIAVAARGEIDRTRVEDAIGGEAELRFFDMPRIDVSSTMVRERAASGQPIRYLVPDKVANFIGAQSLYGASVPS